MKILIILVFSLVPVCAISAQEDVTAKHAAYYLCIDNIETEPYKAYGYCSDYLKKYPDDDKRLTQFAGMFVTAFEKVARYVKSVPVTDFTEVAPGWAVYKPGLSKTMPILNDEKGTYKISISRDYGSLDEEKLLNKAESLYKNPETVGRELLKTWRHLSQEHAALPDGEPKWWGGTFDTIQQTELVTTEAVLYYYDTVMLMRNNGGKIMENSFVFGSANLKYAAAIKKMDVYTRSGKTFKNVYVADLTLTWAQVCGGLCGAGFTRNKIVVLGMKGEILEMFLDDPVNNSNWVS
jgi:hypothetical protein